MLVIPAIDLYEGKVVRLTRGDPSRAKVYSRDPVACARQWEEQGAGLLHVVDLSAALGQTDNLQLIKAMCAAVKVDIEVGGGIRDIRRAQDLLDAGVRRLVIGTRSLDEAFLKSLIVAFGAERICVGVDAKEGRLAVEGWQRQTDIGAFDFIASLKSKGVKWVIYTDINRDGTLAGPDLALVQALSAFPDLRIIASGGVNSLEDIRALKEKAPFLWGVIVGKALYEAHFTLPQAQAALRVKAKRA